MNTTILDESDMKQRKLHGRHVIDDDSDTLHNSSKMDFSSTSTGSYDTTEDLTDTDASSHEKISRRGSFDRKKLPKKKSSNIKVKGRNSIVGKVRFAMKANTLHEVESHEYFSPKERGNYWWSDREKDRMMAKHERLVAKYEQTRSATKPGTSKKTAQDKIGTYRGLESWTAAGSLKLDYTIEQCISAVMDEQDRQWNENDDDADLIAKKSQAVTEDSARQARLNGLQDAQEALKVRGESWSKKGGSDESSVGSAVSTGTAAIAKKKKRSKLLARLDDSHNNKIAKRSDPSDNDDILASLKKRPSREKKKKKKKSCKKSLDENMSTSSSKTRKKKTKPKDLQNSNSSISKQDIGDTTEKDQANSQASKIIQSLTARSQDPPNNTAVEDIVSTSAATAAPASTNTVSSSSAGSSVPVSPLSTHATSNHLTNTDECPLLATLRRQQEQLRLSVSRDQDEIDLPIHQYRQHTVIEDDDGEDDGEETSDLLQTLRRQQKMQAMLWQNKQQDDDDGGSRRMPSYNGVAAKLSSFRIDNNIGGNSEPTAPKYSDPPGRRPRRLASRHSGAISHSIPENPSESNRKNRSRSRSNDRYEKNRSRSTSNDRYEKKNKSVKSVSSSIERASSGDLAPASQSSSFGSFPLSPSTSGKKSLKGLRNGAKKFFKSSK